MIVWQRLRSYITDNKWGLLAIGLTWLIFFSRTITGQSVYFLDDLKIIFYPLETVYTQFQHAWQLPQWSPLFGMGQPLLGWGQLGFFTPLHLILRALWVPPLALLQVSVVTYFAIGLLGMYVWLRSHKVSQAAASLGAITFALSGFAIGHLNHVNFYTSSLLLPWLLYAIQYWLNRPTAHSTAALSLVAAAMVVSGQPQVILYSFIIATLYGLIMFGTLLYAYNQRSRYIIRRVAWLIPAAVIAIALSSFAILPLKEFLPLTERADALPEAELFEFSYPPEHAITLVFPYFFGDHSVYWGAKNFQELAAYVGLLPLLLAGVSLVAWRQHKTLRVWAILLVAISITFALGKYSGIYTYLVEAKLLTTLAIAGRFVFFFDVGIAVLAALGLETLLTTTVSERGKHVSYVLAGLIVVAALLYPFAQYSHHNMAAEQQIKALTHWSDPYFLLLVICTLSFISVPWLLRWAKAATWWLVILSSITLVVIGWQYNPVVPRQQAFDTSVFTPTLDSYTQTTGIPARLYASEHLPVMGNQQLSQKLTEPISANFTVYQPLQITVDPLHCLYFQAYVTGENVEGQVTLSLRDTMQGPALASSIITSEQVSNHSNQSFCFPAIPGRVGDYVTVSVTSETDSGIRLASVGSDDPHQQAFFVRPTNPTPAQLAASQKTARVPFEQTNKPTVDLEQQLLERHIQVTANTSGVRWIGALSVAPYRAWIEEFLANDREPFDGDGIHALSRHRSLVDLMGITHFTQSLEKGASRDPMIDAGYTLVQEKDAGDQLLRLYENPQAFPRAFLIRNAIFQPVADEARHALEIETVDPRKVVFVDGPTPPTNLPPITNEPTIGTTEILHYEPTRVDLAVDTAQEAWLVLTETSTPQWHTYIDDQPAPYYTADTFFRTARLTPGKHLVSFRYYSPAIQQAKWLTLTGLILIVILLAWPFVVSRWQARKNK